MRINLSMLTLITQRMLIGQHWHNFGLMLRSHYMALMTLNDASLMMVEISMHSMLAGMMLICYPYGLISKNPIRHLNNNNKMPL
jgi:hypothetical protein